MRCILSAFLSLILLAAVAGAAESAERKSYPYRWVYVICDQFEADAVEKVRGIAKTCVANGINGIVLSGSLDRLDLDSPYTFKVINKIKNICKEHNLDLIPQIMGVGYNAFMLQHDKNLAEGLPVTDALYIAGDTKATFVQDSPARITGGDFETWENGNPIGFTFPYDDHKVAYPDNMVFKEGKTSIRFEKIGRKEFDAKVIQKIQVTPGRLYKLSFWVKTEGLNPGNPFGSGRFRVEALGNGERRLTFFDPQVSGTSDWTLVEAGFNSKNYSEVTVEIGVFEGKTGRFWLDDIKVEEVGMVNLLRRPGCPLTVRDESSGVVYTEGLDYARVEDIRLNFLFDHDGPEIDLLPGSRIKAGSRLRVSFYQGTAIYQGQTPICMSEPAVYEIWRKQIRLFNEVFESDMYLLGADEIRVAASCSACRSRGISAPQILGECVTRQVEMIREVNPRTKLFIWSDMFDPNHNANERDYYYLVDEDWYGSWKLIPKDLTMVCWYGSRRDLSLEHFSKLGFETLGAGYYDRDNLDNVKGWLESLDRTEGAVGIMYTTWLSKYELLADFGKLVNGWGK